MTVRDLSVNQNTSAASPPAAGSTLGLPTSTLSKGVFHILGSSQTPTSNVIHNVSVNGAYAGFKGQGNVGTGTVLVDQTFNGTIVDYAFVKESATPDVIQTYANGGAGRLTFGSYLPRAGTTLGNNSDMKLWTVNAPGSPAYSNPANFTSNTGVGTFDNINGSIDISGITVGSVYFFYSGYRTMPFFSATMKDTEALVADVPLPVFGDGDTANSTENYVCSLNFVNNNGLDTIDWSLTSNLYNGEPHCSLKGIVLVTSTGQIAIDSQCRRADADCRAELDQIRRFLGRLGAASQQRNGSRGQCHQPEPGQWQHGHQDQRREHRGVQWLADDARAECDRTGAVDRRVTHRGRGSDRRQCDDGAQHDGESR